MKRILKYLITTGLIVGAFILLSKSMQTNYWDIRLAEAATQIYPKDDMTFRTVPFAFRGASVKDTNLLTPPGSPAEGDRYIIGGVGTDSWLNKDNQIAEYHHRTNSDTTWYYYDPPAGFQSLCTADSVLYVYDGSSWVSIGTAIGSGTADHSALANLDYASAGHTGFQSTLIFEHPVDESGNTVSMDQATTSDSGFLSSTDWNTFNNKQSALTFVHPLINTGGSIAMQQATTSDSGFLSDTDWNTFNNKADASHTHIVGDLTDYDTPYAEDTRTDTTNFDGNLSSADDTVQKALETLDEMIGGSGASAFYELSDVDTYAGHAGEYAKVNATEDGIEFGTPAGSGDMTKAVYDLDDDGRVDSAEVVTDGTNYSTAAQVKDAVNKAHAVGTVDVTGSDTTGAIVFQSGVDALESDSMFYYDNVNNRLGIGTKGPEAILHIVSPDANGAGTFLDTYSNTANQGSSVFFRRARGTSSAPLILQSADTLGGCYVRGYNGTAFNTRGGLGFVTDGAWSDTENPIRMSFFTTPATSGSSMIERVRIAPTGYVYIGGTVVDATSNLQIDGSLALDYVTTDTNLTLSSTHTVVNVTGSTGTITITLPTAVGISGRTYYIKSSMDGDGVVTIDGNASETIDGATTYSLGIISYTGVSGVQIISDGANWKIISTINSAAI